MSCRRIISAMFLSIILPVFSYASDFTGTWKGSYYGNESSRGTITIKLKQTDNQVKGTLSTSNGSKARVKGTVNGDVLRFTGKQTVPCSGSFKGTAVMEDDNYMSFTCKASNCYGSEKLAGEATRQ